MSNRYVAFRAFQTGRMYTPHGQRIGYVVLLTEVGGSHLVAFHDVDRMVSNVIRVTGEVTTAKILEQYDRCAYLRDYLIPNAVDDLLQVEAMKLPAHNPR